MNIWSLRINKVITTLREGHWFVSVSNLQKTFPEKVLRLMKTGEVFKHYIIVQTSLTVQCM